MSDVRRGDALGDPRARAPRERAPRGRSRRLAGAAARAAAARRSTGARRRARCSRRGARRPPGAAAARADAVRAAPCGLAIVAGPHSSGQRLPAPAAPRPAPLSPSARPPREGGRAPRPDSRPALRIWHSRARARPPPAAAGRRRRRGPRYLMDLHCAPPVPSTLRPYQPPPRRGLAPPLSGPPASLLNPLCSTAFALQPRIAPLLLTVWYTRPAARGRALSPRRAGVCPRRGR